MMIFHKKINLKKGFTPTPQRGVTSRVLPVFEWCRALFNSPSASLDSLRRHKNTTPRLASGFTLIELLVVVAIIAILSTIILGTLGSARKQARDTKRLADLKQLQTALEFYANSNQDNYPTELAGLVTSGFVASSPLDPGGGSYSYAALGSGANCKKYHLGATLEDTAHPALNADIDAVAGTSCTGSASDFSGTDPVYDLKP